MSADKTYLAVPTVTAFTLVRAKIKEGREYTNNLTGQSFQRVETGGKRVDATLTPFSNRLMATTSLAMGEMSQTARVDAAHSV